MTEEETPPCPKFSLTRAIANGQSIDKWAKANDVKRRTAFYRAKGPEVRSRVDTIRRLTLGAGFDCRTDCQSVPTRHDCVLAAWPMR
jgi:hypothetical protein